MKTAKTGPKAKSRKPAARQIARGTLKKVSAGAGDPQRKGNKHDSQVSVWA